MGETNGTVHGHDYTGYTWEVGQEKTRGSPAPVTYLIGTPGAPA
jgi:hypothetical protein